MLDAVRTDEGSEKGEMWCAARAITVVTSIQPEEASGVEPLTYRTAADCSATELYPRRNRLQRICLDSSGFHLVFESVFLSKYYISLSSLTKREAITGGLCEVLEALEACLLH